MANSMQHWNDDQCCVIDTETTGLDPNHNEMIQIAIVALDSNFKPRKDVIPFNIDVKPDYPERAHPKAMQVNKLSLKEICLRGFDRITAAEMLEEWFDKLGLRYTSAGVRRRVRPLGQNYAFDKGFIVAWLGPALYDHLFHYHYKDTMIAAQYLNDRAAMHANPVPYPRTSLGALAKKHLVEIPRAHRALDDAVATAEVYRRMTKQGLLG